MYSIAVKFAKEAKCGRLIGIMFKTYILPIIEQNSTVWGWENAVLSSKLEKLQRDCTRAVLRSPFRPNCIGYLTYHERLRQLSMIRLDDRRRINALLNMSRFFVDERPNIVRTIFMNCLFDGVSSLRVQRSFTNITEYTTPTSMAGRLAKLACDLSRKFSVDLPHEENKRNLALHYLNSYAE